MPDDPLGQVERVMYLTAAMTGMRQGELFALRWRDVDWSARLAEPRLLELMRDGNPIYAWPFEQRHVWSIPNMPPVARILERATRAR